MVGWGSVAGALLMTAKRIAELRAAGAPAAAAQFRGGFAFYTARRLSAIFGVYAATTLAAYVWIALETGVLLLISLPLWALVILVTYRNAGGSFSDVSAPEKLPSRPSVIGAIALASTGIAVLLVLAT